MEQKSIYIILTRTTTIVSRMIAHLSGDKYSHASLAFDKDLTSMYSFGRRNPNNPFSGGFCQENVNEGVFKKCKMLPYAIVELKVTCEQYEKINELIQEYIKSAAKYRYNYAGLFFAWTGNAYRYTYRKYCSEFVYDLLYQSGILCEEPPSVIHPQELMRFGHVIVEGDWNKDREGIEPGRLAKIYIFLRQWAGEYSL